MDQQYSSAPEIRSPKLVPAVVSGVLISALVVGGGMYAFQKSQADKTRQDLQAQIDDLKQQVRTAKVAQPTPVPASQATPAPAATATPAAVKTYTNPVFKFSLQYPADWKVISDTVQKDTKAESRPGEALMLGPSTSTSSTVTQYPYIGVIVNHGGFDSAAVKNTFTANYQNGKLVLSNKAVNESDAYQPAEGSYEADFSVGSTQYSIWGANLTEDQFKEIVATFSVM